MVFTHFCRGHLYLLCSAQAGTLPAFSWRGLRISLLSPPLCPPLRLVTLGPWQAPERWFCRWSDFLSRLRWQPRSIIAFYTLNRSRRPSLTSGIFANYLTLAFSLSLCLMRLYKTFNFKLAVFLCESPCSLWVFTDPLRCSTNTTAAPMRILSIFSATLYPSCLFFWPHRHSSTMWQRGRRGVRVCVVPISGRGCSIRHHSVTFSATYLTMLFLRSWGRPFYCVHAFLLPNNGFMLDFIARICPDLTSWSSIFVFFLLYSVNLVSTGLFEIKAM